MVTTKYLTNKQLKNTNQNLFNSMQDEKVEVVYKTEQNKLNGAILGNWIVTDVKTANYTAKVGEIVLVNSAGGAITITPPFSKLELGDMFTVIDAGADAGTNAITVDTSGQKYHSLSVDKVLINNSEAVTLMWTGNTTFGWVQI